MSKPSPSISSVLLSCNGEAFVAEALRSALAQDCEPMELIVSDDASDDRTFEILEREIAAYRGPHRVELRRRSSNSGSKSAHLNDVFGRTSGDLLLTFDDDDVSHPSRVRKIAAAFRRDPDVAAVYSSYTLIDEAGRDLGRAKVPHPSPGEDATAWFARVDANASGTTLAIRRDVVERFGPMDPGIYEDILLPFRASLLGTVVYLDEDLVRARRRPGSLTAGFDRFDSLERYRARMRWGVERARAHLASRLADLETARALFPDRAGRFAPIADVARASMADAEASLGLVSPSWVERVRALARLLRSGAYPDDRAQNACLALFPASYLRYKRRKLGIAPKGAIAGRP